MAAPHTLNVLVPVRVWPGELNEGRRMIWKTEEEQLLIERFETADQDTLEKLFPGHSWNSIKSKASRLNLPPKGVLCRKDSADVNHDFFKEPNELNSYWAGFIAADGCVVNGRIQISINKVDEPHLKQFLYDVESSANISYGKDNTVKISIPSSKWIEGLRDNFNIGPRKSLTLQPPAGLSKKQTKAFITGYIDGDGCWRYGAQSKGGKWKYIVLEVVGTNDFLTWMASHLDGNASIRNVDNYYVLSSSCMNAFKTYIQLWNPELPILDRKWDKQYKVWNPRS